jgi:hypothetical protein
MAITLRDSIDTIAPPRPKWLKDIAAEAKCKGLNKLSMRQINAEIAAARRERRLKAKLTAPAK